MDEQDKIDRRHFLERTSDSFHDLPILARVQFVKNLLLFNRGDKESNPQDPAMILATEVLTGVIEVLESRPRVAKLRGPALD
jgi:hypothetical protein